MVLERLNTQLPRSPEAADRPKRTSKHQLSALSDANFGGAAFGDALQIVYLHLTLAEVFRCKRVCRVWRDAIDDCSASSGFWRDLCCRHACGRAPRTRRPQEWDAPKDWLAVARACARDPLPSLKARLVNQPQTLTHDGSALAAPFEAAEVERLLDTLATLGELAIVDCPDEPLIDFFSTETRSLVSLAVYLACSQKPADPTAAGRGLQRTVYSWWRREAPALAARVRRRTGGAPPAVRARAAERLAAFVKFMVAVALPYVDRSYVRIFSSSTLRVLSVKAIGTHAVACCAPPPEEGAEAAADCGWGAMPPPPEDDVALDAAGEVDEAALLALGSARMLEQADGLSMHGALAALGGGAPWLLEDN